MLIFLCNAKNLKGEETLTLKGDHLETSVHIPGKNHNKWHGVQWDYMNKINLTCIEDVRSGQLQQSKNDCEESKVVAGSEQDKFIMRSTPQTWGHERKVPQKQDRMRGHQFSGTQLIFLHLKSINDQIYYQWFLYWLMVNSMHAR